MYINADLTYKRVQNKEKKKKKTEKVSKKVDIH